jgi:hypothetical protein
MPFERISYRYVLPGLTSSLADVADAEALVSGRSLRVISKPTILPLSDGAPGEPNREAVRSRRKADGW